jgi:hypothetical protein
VLTDWQVVREQVARPVDAVARRPRLLAVAVQAVDRDDAAAALAAERRCDWRESPLEDRVDALAHHLQALGSCKSCCG